MFGRKTGFFAAAALTAMLLGGCGQAANNLGGATDGYGDAVYGNNDMRGYGYWDGYGINSGNTAGNVDRSSYGMRKAGWDIGNGVERAADAVTGGAATTNDRMK